jgi:hypothetical protein
MYSKQELNTYLTDETIAGRRSDVVKRQTIHHEMMRLTVNDGHGSGTVNHGVVNLNGEKEYEEKAGAY